MGEGHAPYFTFTIGPPILQTHTTQPLHLIGIYTWATSRWEREWADSQVDGAGAPALEGQPGGEDKDLTTLKVLWGQFRGTLPHLLKNYTFKVRNKFFSVFIRIV